MAKKNFRLKSYSLIILVYSPLKAIKQDIKGEGVLLPAIANLLSLIVEFKAVIVIIFGLNDTSRENEVICCEAS